MACAWLVFELVLGDWLRLTRPQILMRNDRGSPEDPCELHITQCEKYRNYGVLQRIQLARHCAFEERKVMTPLNFLVEFRAPTLIEDGNFARFRTDKCKNQWF